MVGYSSCQLVFIDKFYIRILTALNFHGNSTICFFLVLTVQVPPSLAVYASRSRRQGMIPHELRDMEKIIQK